MFAHPYRQRTHLRRAAAKAAASLGWLVAVLAAVAGGLLAAAAVVPAAFAMTLKPQPLPGAQYRPVPAGSAPAAAVHVVTADGMAGWQIALIAVGAAVVAAVAVVLLDRVRPPAAPPPPAPPDGVVSARAPYSRGPGLGSLSAQRHKRAVYELRKAVNSARNAPGFVAWTRCPASMVTRVP